MRSVAPLVAVNDSRCEHSERGAMLRVLHGTYSANSGGAARAAFRVHCSLRSAGIASSMLVADGLSSGRGVFQVPRNRGVQYLSSGLESRVAKLQRTDSPILHSTALFPGSAGRALRAADADVIQLGWVGRGYLSVEDIGKLLQEQKVVWRLPDMWAFCGAEHYADDGASARWRSGYTRSNRPRGHSGLDVDRLTWLRKQSSWTHPAHIVTPSRWLRDCVAGSALMADWPVTVIPNPLDLEVFRPHSRHAARSILGISESALFVVFGADGGTRTPIKGWNLLTVALSTVARYCPNLEVGVFGESGELPHSDLGVRAHNLGLIRDDRLLALIYSAADIVAVPSRQEAFGQVASEAQACGTPVAAFATTGLIDVVEHESTGYLATPFDPADLAKGILSLACERTSGALGQRCRNRAEKLWSPAAVAAQYMEVYQAASVKG